MPEKLKILIADAHTLTREGIKALLAKRNDLKAVGEATESSELFKMVRSLKPDVVIIDPNLVGNFSLADVTFLRKNFPGTGILIVTSHQNRESIIKVLESGVSSYILKECDEAEIIGGIYAAARNENFFCGKVLDAVLAKAVHQCPEVGLCNHCKPVNLSQREVEIVQCISAGLTTKHIADKLFLSFHTISTHRKNIFRKLEVHNTSELLLFAIKSGIINPEVSLGLS